MKVHIFTLTWQGKDKIQKLKTSLLPAVENLDWIWHIKENGSTDGSVEEIKNWNHPNVNLIAYPDNKNNYSQGMNFLFKEANAQDNDLVLTLNNDVIIKDTQSLHNMVNLIAHDPGIGVVGAKLNYTNTNKIQHCGVLFHKYNKLPFHFRGGVEEAPRDKTNRYYPAVTGAVSLVRADVFANCYTNKSGNKGFNEDYHFAFEDVDFCLRIERHLKKKNVYCGETEIFHEESASLKKNPINKMFMFQNSKIFLEQWSKSIDISLTSRYENPDYAIYRKKEMK